MKFFLINLLLLSCFSWECRASKYMHLPLASEFERLGNSYIHPKSGFTGAEEGVLADDPKIEGPSGIGIEATNLIGEYSAVYTRFKDQIYDTPRRMPFWVILDLRGENAKRWQLVTPSGKKYPVGNGDFSVEGLDPDTIAEYYFQELAVVDSKSSAGSATAPANSAANSAATSKGSSGGSAGSAAAEK
jgi:hypothetical protein